MQKRSTENSQFKLVKKMLIDAGWQPDDCLEEPFFHSEGVIIRPDFLISIDAYPVAVVELKAVVGALDSVKKQLDAYRSAINTPYAFAVVGKRIYQLDTANDRLEEITSFPAKNNVKESLNIKESCGPVLKNLQQMQAVASVISAIQGGARLLSVVMSVGTGRHVAMLKLVAKLIAQNPNANVLVVFERGEIKSHFSELSSKYGVRTFDIKEVQGEGAGSVVVVAGLEALELYKDKTKPSYVIFSDLHREKLAQIPIAEFGESTLISIRSMPDARADEIFGKPIYAYTISNAMQDELLTPPQGFTTFKLGEIATITIGRYVPRRAGEDELMQETVDAKLIKAYDLRDDINFETLTTTAVKLDDKGIVKLQDGDILLSRIFSNWPRLGIVRGCKSDHVLLSQSVILIRVTDKKVGSEHVYNFLKSDTGRNALVLYASHGATSQKALNPSSLREIGIFVPDDYSFGGLEQLSTAKKTIREIKENILPLLEDIEFSYSSPRSLDSLSLEAVGRRLEQLAKVLVPAPLENRVLTSYPTPIAIPYQRFLNARFNVFEQVMRLRDVYEAICFFVYNIVLSDACRRLGGSECYVENKKARMAFNNFSMADRLTFVESIQQNARKNSSVRLFVPELAQAFSVPDARKLKDDLRNQAAHTATAPESQQKRVLTHFLPIVEGLLDRLSFLEKYQMVRITSFYYKGCDLTRRMEVYAGVSPFIDEQVLAEGVELIPADRDHIVLIDAEGNILDLHPIYQLVSNETTRFESHIAFLKQRSGGKLEGESVQGAYNLELDGFEDFEFIRDNLQKH